MTSVVRIQRKNGTVVQDCDVYIGRSCTRGGWNLKQSKWHNPFSVQIYGRDECLSRYKDYILGKIEEDPIFYNLEELRGKTLGCWCKPERCHGDILREILNV